VICPCVLNSVWYPRNGDNETATEVLFMLTKIVIRGFALPGVLALTPNFFMAEVQPEVKKDDTRAVCIHLVWPSVFRNWIVVRSVKKGKRGMREFPMGKRTIAIPEKQLGFFEGKLLGCNSVAGQLHAGFLEAA
jgi:hypothetical protein